ncbi:MAG: peptide deformylase, partial [Thermotogaceae bacterium]|nr:peptide deformylase [Thermotogaceae bacterium]
MRKIRLLGDPVLRRRSKEVEALNKNVESIVEELFQIMYSEDGVGLAAPQIGVSLRI